MMILRKLASRLYTSRPKFTVLFSSAGVIFSNFFFFRNAASKLYPYKLKKFLNSRVSFKIFHLKCFSFFYLIRTKTQLLHFHSSQTSAFEISIISRPIFMYLS